MHQLDNTNALLYAAKSYDNSQCFETVEFYDDLNRFKYIKRLLNKWRTSNTLKERLLVNHLIVLYNVFGNQAATRLLFLKLEGYYSELLPFLDLMNKTPNIVQAIGIPPTDIDTRQIDRDIRIVKLLSERIQ